MIYFLALIPATGLTMGGYFMIYLSDRSTGTFRSFGRYLGFWAFTLAALVILGAIFAAAQGGARRAMMLRAGPGYMMRGTVPRLRDRFENPSPPQAQGAPPAAQPPAAPAIPAPASP